MRNRLLKVGVLPENIMINHKLSYAACNFSFNLMSGHGFDKVYSIMPLYVGGIMEKEAFEDPRFELVYDKLRLRGGLLQKFAVFKEQWTIFRNIPRLSSIWYYNMNTLSAFLFILLKVFKPSVQQNVIVLDFTPVVRGFGLNRIYLNLINLAHGRICLANSPLFKVHNSVILPGVVPNSENLHPLVEIPQKTFLLSGAINETIAQTLMVLETFAQLTDYELHVTGTGDTQLVEEYAAKYPNIHWHGQLPFNKYLELLHSVTFQLSTRDPKKPENQCNFPSKIIEALLHNRAIISTIHYPQLNGVNYFEIGSNSMLEDIRKIASMPFESINDYVNQGSIVSERFSTKVWNDTMTKIENS